jgi:transposase
VRHGAPLGSRRAGSRPSRDVAAPQYVRPYVRRNKTDRTDAEALLEAVRSGQITPVRVKSVAQQELLALHRVRAEWMATRKAIGV